MKANRNSTGRVGKRPIGRYRYWKRLADSFVPITVAVFPLEVEGEVPEFREQSQRLRGWLSPEEAELLIDDPELKSIIRDAEQLLRQEA